MSEALDSDVLEHAGVVAGLGHTGADARGFGEALRSLRKPLVTHLIHGMEPLHQVDPVAAGATATSTPAALLDLDDRGSLATGLRADLVVLDRDWQVRQVMFEGDWVGTGGATREPHR